MNRKIIDTKHAIDRYADRYRNIISREDVNEVIYNGMDKIIDNYDDTSAVYALYSKSTGICAVIDWRKDYKSRDNLNHAIVVTLPPPKRSFSDFHTTSPKDIKIMVENHIDSLVKTKKLKESFNYIQKQSINGLDVFMEDGVVYDYGIDFYLEVI